jgi:hypothetical protein
MRHTLRFFTTRISDNRNYVEIVSGDYVIKRDDLDFNELRLLQKWFDSYCRNAIRDLGVKLEQNRENGVVFLQFTTFMGEVYANPDFLEERLQQLEQIEADIFKQIDYIKQPKF